MHRWTYIIAVIFHFSVPFFFFKPDIPQYYFADTKCQQATNFMHFNSTRLNQLITVSAQRPCPCPELLLPLLHLWRRASTAKIILSPPAFFFTAGRAIGPQQAYRGCNDICMSVFMIPCHSQYVLERGPDTAGMLPPPQVKMLIFGTRLHEMEEGWCSNNVFLCF